MLKTTLQMGGLGYHLQAKTAVVEYYEEHGKMTRDDFAKLPIEKQGSIANYMQSLIGLKRQRIMLVMLAVAALAPMLISTIFGQADASSFQGPAFMLTAIEFILSPSSTIAVLLLMTATTVVMSWSDFRHFFSSRKAMNELGIMSKDIRGLTDDDVFHLFVLPQLERQGVRVRRD